MKKIVLVTAIACFSLSATAQLFQNMPKEGSFYKTKDGILVHEKVVNKANMKEKALNDDQIVNAAKVINTSMQVLMSEEPKAARKKLHPYLAPSLQKREIKKEAFMALHRRATMVEPPIKVMNVRKVPKEGTDLKKDYYLVRVLSANEYVEVKKQQLIVVTFDGDTPLIHSLFGLVNSDALERNRAVLEKLKKNTKRPGAEGNRTQTREAIQKSEDK